MLTTWVSGCCDSSIISSTFACTLSSGLCCMGHQQSFNGMHWICGELIAMSIGPIYSKISIKRVYVHQMGLMGHIPLFFGALMTQNVRRLHCSLILGQISLTQHLRFCAPLQLPEVELAQDAAA